MRTGIKTFDKPGQRGNALDLKKQKQLDTELVYLQDPLKLAENTIALLRNDDNDKAHDLVRRASKRMSCTVSWNHLVDYAMSTGSVKRAVHIYNEMKKRAQKPDAHTYTILLRGLSWHPHLQDSLPLALKIYHSMFAEDCPIKPNIIHTNAVLKVCAMARDMDALWGVAAKLPQKGPGAPNNLTFTTILNAIRAVAWHNDKDLRDEDWEEKSLRRQRAVVQGRKIWEEIIPRWRSGDIFIDEELVCAMGRLLLLGSTERDYDDILSLAEQVMGLPRQKRQLGEPREITGGEGTSLVTEETTVDRASQHEPSLLEVSNDHPEVAAEDETSLLSTPAPVINTALANVFRPKSSSPNISKARPGRNTLSLVLDACINLRAVPSAQAYWGLLTDPSGPYNVTPDSENYHMYLRVLRVQRASKAACDLIQDMHSGDLKSMQLLQPKTFRIAFSACARNKANARVMEHATPILHIMCKTLTQPDLKCLEMFRDLASSQVQRDFHITLNALREMETGVRLLRNYVNYGNEDVVVDNVTKTAAIDFARRLLGVFDKVRQTAGDRLEREEKNYIIAQKSALDLWAQRRVKIMRAGKRYMRMRSGQIPRSEEMPLVRKKVERWTSGKHTLKLEDRAEKALGVGRRKRMQRAEEARERTGEFDGFV
ncbi:MAG: hypothetical protein Q9180_004812 [Flavoplaca navasiana]